MTRLLFRVGFCDVPTEGSPRFQRLFWQTRDYWIGKVAFRGGFVLLWRVPGIVAVGGDRSQLAVIGTAFRLKVLVQGGIAVDIDVLELV